MTTTKNKLNSNKSKIMLIGCQEKRFTLEDSCLTRGTVGIWNQLLKAGLYFEDL